MKLLFILTLLISPKIYSDTLIIDRFIASKNVNKPSKGMKKMNVLEVFGEPLTISNPVGSPPITTWKYKLFTVYFEHNHVIHAVVNKANSLELGPKPSK